jgi:YfiH family protein
MIDVVAAGWPAPPGVRALTVTRRGPGFSAAPYDSLNVGAHVGDDPHAVARNRDALIAALALPSAPRWLRQVHGTAVAELELAGEPEADAAITREGGVVLAIQTADCLPLLVASADGAELAAIHAGWRGLAAGVIEATLERLRTPRARLQVWLGPAIGPARYEVGVEVRDAFPGAEEAFAAAREGHWLCDLYALARRRLERAGVGAVFGGDLCTASDPARFYSHRRDGARTGRLASLIWRA